MYRPGRSRRPSAGSVRAARSPSQWRRRSPPGRPGAEGNIRAVGVTRGTGCWPSSSTTRCAPSAATAVELAFCRRQLDQLNDAVRHERATLRDVLSRLAAAGLVPDQLTRLSGLSDDELSSLLREPASLGNPASRT